MTQLEQWARILHGWLTPLAEPLTALYVLVLGVIALYGLHRYWLVYLYLRHARRIRSQTPAGEPWRPRVTVQLPMYNEGAVARRVIEAACALDYPRELLQIQVLDDSTDDSAEATRRLCEALGAQGHPVEYRHRTHRTGYKAGALQEALPDATGELVAVFDADFVPPADTLARLVGHFRDPRVGMVQARWGHLNRDDSLLTQSQAVYLDGHFVVEHAARHASGRWFNFNGTAGVWRRRCIEQAGGWQHDTLTEDVDLSYRAQLLGWRFVYDPALVCPAELPPCVSAFKSQQHRWSKGSVQTALKLLPRILASDAPVRNKIEAWFHLTSPIVYVCVVALSLLLFPAFFVQISPVEGDIPGAIFGFTAFSMATASAGVFYILSQTAQGRSAWQVLWRFPVLMAMGIGISVNNARGVVEALLGLRSGFVRTPKFGAARRSQADPIARRWRLPRGLIEVALGALMLACLPLATTAEETIVSMPFLMIFAAGYLWMGLGSVRDTLMHAV